MDSIHIRIGQNLQRIRKQRGLSLDKVASATNVSKGMLHQIERGEVTPTVTTVWKIATGLNISFSSLLKDEEAAVSIVTAGQQPDITEDDGRCKVFLLFPFDPQTLMEIFLIELSPGANYCSAPHNDGVLEYITVHSGSFTIQVKEETYTLGQGEAIRFTGNALHCYMNLTAQNTVIQVIMHYPEA
ncbi:helix-turn-helix domain-containing protein [Brevibacillus nitrificans]|uniref:helix-turn-helix domain-containing protein n=1 Tax=Brevibacillus nitrificans TaxID=651560 RepID=UPI0026259DA9|nr:XRE family transcriptional regulator [Brevibacillus nitrificans]MED1796484.1 XRE family transcriptional regulator [Brevibacillus nitrificans]